MLLTPISLLLALRASSEGRAPRTSRAGLPQVELRQGAGLRFLPNSHCEEHRAWGSEGTLRALVC